MCRLIPLLVLLLTPPAYAAAPPDPVGPAVRRGLARLQQGAARYVQKRDCFSCHHQAVTVAAFAEAHRRGLAVDRSFLAAQVDFTLDTFRPRLDRVRKGQSVSGGNTMAAYALFTLRQAGHPADETTAALVRYLLVRQRPDGSWPALMPRPPSEGSPFTNAALALEALSHYGAGPAVRREADAAFARGKRWLLAAEPKTHEDEVFRLRGLVTVGAGRAAVARARDRLLAGQRADGSWAQLPGRPGDAYATATALLALRAAGLGREDTACRRAVAHLLGAQNADGSWVVTTRSRPVQAFFDNGDPGGKSQFISFLATGWATWALLDSLPSP